MSKSSKSFLLNSLTVSILCVTASVQAKTSDTTLQLPTTVVTATRLATPQKDLVGDIRVINEEELKTHQGQSLLDVLVAQPSIQVKTYGGLGQSGGVFIRGNNQNHALILVDGMPVGSATTGTASIQGIGAEQIERVEILYGSSATSLYGSSAIGGVIQIFTKANSKKQYSEISIAAGTENTLVASASTNGRFNKTRYGLNISGRKTDGINTTKEFVPFNNYEDDKDANENLGVNLALSHQFTDDIAVGANYLINKSETEYDSGKKDQTTLNKGDLRTASVWAKQRYKKLTFNTQLSVSEDDNAYEDNFGKSAFDTKQTQVKADLGYKLPQGKLLAGYEKTVQKIEGSTKYNLDKRDTDSILLGYLLSNNVLQAQANVRHDMIKDYKDVTTYALGLAVSPKAGVRLGANYATGFNQPTFNQLYYPKYGNPNLKPEKSKNAEIFAELSKDAFLSRVTVYHNRVTDLISGNKNINKAEFTGFSVKTDYTLDSVLLGFNYDYLDAQDISADKELEYRAKHTAGVYAGINQPKWSVRAEVNYTDKRKASYSDAQYKKVDTVLDGYTLANLYASYKISPYIDITLRANNLLDKDYQTSYGYSNLGFNALAGLKIHTK